MSTLEQATIMPDHHPCRAPLRLGRRGSVTILFAFAALALMASIGAAFNMAQLATGRAALQRAVDNAALSGAASYSANSAAFNALALTVATSAFCDATTALPLGGSIVIQAGAQSCGTSAGPSVTATTAAYVTGVPGVANAPGISCASGYLPPAPYHCGFVVTVRAMATVTSILPIFFTPAITISATGAAANPFINFATVFSLPGGIGTAKYANSVWAYPVLLNSEGGIDTATNAGALPDTSACTGGPDQVVCGNYVMLASTMYASKGIGYIPPGQTTIYDNGIVRNPVSPTGITATTPLGIAFRSIAGGNTVDYPTPGVYGYNVTNLGYYLPSYQYAPNGCVYPYSHLVYNTVTQVWASAKTQAAGGTSTTYAPVLPWSLVTHWFYSSYLTQNLPPSQSEINAQTPNNEDVPSVTSDPAQIGANIGGNPTYNANPTPAVSTTCPPVAAAGGAPKPNDLLQTTTYITSGNSNCSLYITSSATSGYPPPSYVGSCFAPAATPGKQYAALSCQAYGNAFYTFYWNDMGGAQYDDDNYANGIVQISCAGTTHVILLQ